MIMIPERMHCLLTQSLIGYLCTADSKNQPHITPIFVIYNPETQKIYFQTSRTSKKVKDIRANSNVSLTLDNRDPINPFKNEGVQVMGKAEIMEMGLTKAIFEEGHFPEDVKITLDIFRSRFAKVLSKEKSAEKVVVKINISRMVYWRGPKFHSVTV